MHIHQDLDEVNARLERALTEVASLRVLCKDEDFREQLGTIFQQVSEICWEMDQVVKLQPLMEQFEAADSQENVKSFNGHRTVPHDYHSLFADGLDC